MKDREKTAVAADAKLLWRSGANVESLVKFMRESGLRQAQSIEFLEQVAGFDGIKAQIAVIYSETWRDQLQRNVELNQQFIDALIQLGEGSGAPVITETELDATFDPEAILRSTIAT